MASSLSVLDKFWISLLSIWVFVSVSSNMFVVACIWKKAKDTKRHGHRALTSTDMMIVNLAVNDILLAGIFLPQKIHDLSHADHYFECEFFTVLVVVVTSR